ncbi:MAG: SUMF1/EgtB/PvdO family nonheme iron enzyme [Planctomycetota bacterium]
MTHPISRNLGAPFGLTFALAALVTLSPASAQDKVTVDSSSVNPPGLVVLKAGRVTAGTKPKAIEALMTTASNQGMIRVIDGETPEHKAPVSAFAIGQFEVTNEQYLEFINATGTRPPENWAGEALNKARADFLKAEAEKSRAASAEGLTYDRQKWDEAVKDRWWKSTWQDVDWSIPKGQEAMPVSYVDFENASAYAQWAGLRLPSEYEWIYAARGSDAKIFPWGDEWEASGRAHTAEIGSEKPKPIGSFPDGKSEFGVFDMCGSVWEWTDSGYEPYPRFKPNTYTFKKARGKEKVKPEPRFNPAFRIIKGGSAQLPLLAGRISTRQGALRSQTTSAIGFRVASSQTPGVDKARSIFESKLQNSPARTESETFDFGGVISLDRWTTEAPDRRPEGYSVIKDYEYLIFAPRTDFEFKGAELKLASRAKPIVLGFLSTTVPLQDPELPPGDYLVSYREKGRVVEAGDEDEEEGAEGEGEGEEEEPEVTDETPIEYLTPEERLLRLIDLKQTLIIFQDMATGEYVTSIPASKLGNDIKATKADNGRISHDQKAAFNEDKEKITEDYLKLHANIRRSSSRVIPFDLTFKVDGPTLGTDWRTASISPTGK